MILTHPFGAMYGGLLNLGEWETRYQVVKEQIKMLEAKQMQVNTVPPRDDAEARLRDGVGKEGAGDDAGEDDEEKLGEEYDEDDQDVDSKKQSNPRTSKSGSKPRASSLPPPPQVELSPEDIANATRLKLTKRYIADAMEFIREVEGAMDVLSQLLGSTSKAEVLEAIEFWKVAFEYQMAGASVSCRHHHPFKVALTLLSWQISRRVSNGCFI
jgi:condensin complex subunit 1